MCTALAMEAGRLYFGRTLDHTGSYGERVIVMPRRFPLPMRHERTLEQHYAMVGIGCVRDGFPLYYDGINEKGLAMAGLNFTQSADYGKPMNGKTNVAQFELLPWVLGNCATVEEARTLLDGICVTDTAFSTELPPARLHWILADDRETVVLEIMADGMHMYPNLIGVLANEPPFPLQMVNLKNYVNLTTDVPENRFSKKLPLRPYSRGMGALGLPGDLSSMSRFVRAAFWKEHALWGETEVACTAQFFHLLDTVKMVKGCCRTEAGEEEYTLYQSCYHNGVCYYTTYENRQITAVDMMQENLDGEALISPTLKREPIIG